MKGTDFLASKPRAKRRPGRWKPCAHCGTPFWCFASKDVGGSLPETKLCGKPCANAARQTPEARRSRFWAKVDKSAGPDACWLWTGAVTSKHGYGCTQTGGRRVLGAHKVAWTYTNGDPGELCVLHRCDNRVCVNPAHLFLGTKQDNVDDMYEKGRDRCRGGKNVWAKLTDELVQKIRAEYRCTKAGRRTTSSNAKELAAKYGVGHGTITTVASGRSWRHLA